MKLDLTYLTTRQMSEAFPAFPISTLHDIMNAGNCPAVMRIKIRPENKNCKVVWCKELFELWVLGNSEELSHAIEDRKDAIRSFLNGLIKAERGGPRKLGKKEISSLKTAEKAN